MISKPTVAKAKPTQIEKIVLGISSPPNPTKVAKARSINEKISGFPKDRATDANNGAKPVNSTVEIVPPIKEARAAVTSATCAFPDKARGRPSKTVATAVEAPGIPNVIDEIAPPYIAP